MRPMWMVLTLVVCASTWAVLRSLEGHAEEAKKNEEAPAPTACYKPVAPLDAVMSVVGDVFDGMKEKVKASKYKELKREALFLAEMGHMASQIEARCKEKDWISKAEKVKAAALQMAADAGKKDEAGFKKSYAIAGEGCESCHDKYRDS
jgi:cytochrome c556